MHKNATKCNKTLSKWCKNKHGASKIMDTLEMYQSSLDHGHKTSWWRECFFFDDRLSWFDDMLDCGGLVALLHHVRRWVRWWWWCIVSHATCDRLLGSHLVLKRLTEPKELPALDEEMRGFLPSILVDVGVPGTPSVEHFFCRKWRLITTPMPLCFWPRIAVGASTTASVVIVPLPWSIVVVIMVIVYVAYCYHIRRIRIFVAVSTSFLPRAGVELILWVDVTVC
jgi:hypothetical protein